MSERTRRAVGIIRVSQVKGRSGESFSSPKDQREEIERLCETEGWRLIAAHDELQVSGNALLEDRPGLSQAVTAVLTGAADIIVGAHSERLWWSHEVRAQVLRLVEGAGGEVWAVDVGKLSNGSAAEDFSGEVRTSADRFTRRQNAEKSLKAVKRAIARGVAPWPHIVPGYDRGPDGILVTNDDAETIRRAFELRASGQRITDVRAYLAENGIDRNSHQVSALLANRAYRGEIHFGEKYEPNLAAHVAIVDADTFQRVQRVRVPQGRKPKSERLLARLGVLLCGTCAARMVIGSQRRGEKRYVFYRCPTEDCEQRVAIGAEIAERVVVDAVRAALADTEGRASAETNAREVELELERAQFALDGAIKAFSGLDDEPAALDRLRELRDVRDEVRDRHEQLGGQRAAVVISGSEDWDLLTLDEQRALVRATVERALVAPGRGADRVTVKLFGD